MSQGPLRPAVRPYQGKSNRWWFKLTAISFTVKVLLLVAFFFGIRYAAHVTAQPDAPTTAESAR